MHLDIVWTSIHNRLLHHFVSTLYTHINCRVNQLEMTWRKPLDMSSLLMTTRGQMLVLLIVLALTSCVREVLSSSRCITTCHRSEEDSLCTKCKFREPMRFGKRSNKQTYKEPLRFGKRLQDFTDYGLDKKSVSLTPRLIRLLMAADSEESFP